MIHANAVSGSYQTAPHANTARFEFNQALFCNAGWLEYSTPTMGADKMPVGPNVAAAGGFITTNYDNIFKHQLYFSESVVVPTLVAGRIEDIKGARQTLRDLAELRDNWDGYGGFAISAKANEMARNFLNEIEAAPNSLPVPEISPTPSGTISFEWEIQDTNVYIEIGNTRYSGFIKVDRHDPILLQGPAESLGHQVVAEIHSITSPHQGISAPITDIRPRAPQRELVPA
jgi:hypothetical protein